MCAQIKGLHLGQEQYHGWVSCARLILQAKEYLALLNNQTTECEVFEASQAEKTKNTTSETRFLKRQERQNDAIFNAGRDAELRT